MTRTKALWGAPLVALALVLGASAAADQQVAGKQGSKLEQQIESSLQRDPELKNNHIGVRVNNGVAALRGTVDTDAEKAKAERLAFVDGVTRVDNQLDVSGAGAAQADSALTAKVTSNILADSQLRGTAITVAATNGVVKLSGTVTSQDQNQHAVDVARNTEGVHRVQDDLRVSAPLPPTAPPLNPAPIR
jgi:osmotically-inducible protein OsmY